MSHTHFYKIKTIWQGNPAEGNAAIRTYTRSHIALAEGKPSLQLTTDNKAVGDPSQLNPEDLLVTSISSCHLLSYLYVCALEGIVITHYEDNATGVMEENGKGGGQFKEVVLRPVCKVAHPDMKQRALELHHKAHEVCYIANSVNFEVRCEPSCID